MIKLDIDMPKNCYECVFLIYMFGKHYRSCIFNDKISPTITKRPKKCPLIEDEVSFGGIDERTGIEYGINSDGMLYLGNDKSGYNLDDTPQNRERILCDFRMYTR